MLKMLKNQALVKLKNILKKNILDKYLLEDQFVNYLMKYNKNKIFEDKSIIFNDNDKKFSAQSLLKKIIIKNISLPGKSNKAFFSW